MPGQRQPSDFQIRIIDWIREGQGDAIIQAVAGSGKTTTLEMAWAAVRERTPDAHAIFLAFNRSVAQELGARLSGLEARTLHSLGNRPTRAAVGAHGQLSPSKYRGLALRRLRGSRSSVDKYDTYLATDLARVATLARLSLSDTTDRSALHKIVEQHNIGRGFGRVEGHLEIVSQICEEGLEMARAGVIDFTDQVWLPAVLQLPVPQYDWVFVDEAQDLNVAQLELVRRSRADGGRLLFVGDAAQAIYGFAGADTSALSKIERELGATKLPLSVTYRCPRSHVEAAREIVVQLEARPGAPEGMFDEIGIEEGLGIMRPDDMVLCREVAPAVAVQQYLDNQGREAFVDDQERKREMERLLERYRHDRIHPGNLERHLGAIVEKADGARVTGDDSRIDIIRALLIVIAGCSHDYHSFGLAVRRVFEPRSTAARCMTIHKAKGLEADRVFLIRPDLLPHRYAVRPWQRVQEENLLYVALTRAKQALYICNGDVPIRPMADFSQLSPLVGGRGVWGTNFTMLRAHVGRPSGPMATTSRASIASERKHQFHNGSCLLCGKPESMARRFEWSCT